MEKIIMLLSGWGFCIIFLILYISGSRKFKAEAEAVDKEKFMLSDIFVVGMSVVRIFKINTSNKNPKKRQLLAELFGREYVEFYCMILTSAQISYILMILPLAFFMGAMADSAGLVIVFLLVGALLAWYTSSHLNTALEEQHVEILLDYPNVLSNLALLVNAGMMLREAWKVVSENGTRKLYREMQNVTRNIANGYSEPAAYSELADNCKINEIKKFVSVINQNIQKGGSELVYVLKELSNDAWSIKRNTAKMRGDAAATKLIIPVGITFVGILVMIMVPIMANMNLG